MTTWTSFRQQVRRTVLGDVPVPGADPRYTDEMILDAFGWAIDTFAEHTAFATGVSYTGVTVTEYDIPENLYESLDVSGLVTLVAGSNIQYLEPVRYTPEIMNLGTGIWESDQGFYIWNNKINLTFTPTSDSDNQLNILYFAYYPRPVLGSDVLQIPRWAEGALAFLTGAYTLMSTAVGSAQIDRWKQSPDRGEPEDNALRKQSDWMMKQYEIMINQHNRQDRENFFRRDR